MGSRLHPRHFRLLSALLAGALAACLPGFPFLAGGGTDTDTGSFTVTGLILTSAGAPSECAEVTLRPETFLADPADTAGHPGIRRGATDSEGRFAFDSLPVGEYLIEARCGADAVALIPATVKPGSGSRIRLAPGRLQTPGSLEGSVRFSDGLRRPFLVQAYGTGVAAYGDSASGTFRITNMAPAIHRIRISSPIDFQQPAERDVEVRSGETADLGEVLLEPRPKQGFHADPGGLSLDGVGPDNPILYENDRLDNTLDDEYLWVKASQGLADLRGIILPGHPSGSADSFRVQHWTSLRELRLARLAGLRNIPEPVPGAYGRLTLRDTGGLDRIPPQVNAGSALMVAEARKATIEKPLLVFCGGSLLTVANAYLLDPAIAERMVVFGTFNSSRVRGNQDDSLAVFLIARKCRLVAWAEDEFGWEEVPNLLPASAPVVPGILGSHLADQLKGSIRSVSFFGDLGALPWLFTPRLFRTARGADAKAPPLSPATPANPLRPDFLLIPVGATDYPGLVDEAHTVLSAPGAYHPWPVPGLIEAEAYQAQAGTTLVASDSLSEGAVGSLEPGDQVQYSIRIAEAGTYRIEIRGQATGSGQVSIRFGGSQSALNVDLPPGPDWSVVSAPVTLEAGASTLSLQGVAGNATLDWIRLSR